MLPQFNSDGVLPPGDYPITLTDLRVSHLVLGQSNLSQTWDVEWRRAIVDNLATMVGQLRKVGVTEIFVDGSFVEDKDHPNDIDGYFECERIRLASGTLLTALNLLDPYKVWTWDVQARMFCPVTAKLQLPMWHQYHVELYPHIAGMMCGIKDQRGNELEFPSAFRQSRRNSLPKGILKIV